jgi:hypothetical protein
MTNDQIESLKPGDIVAVIVNTNVKNFTLTDVLYVTECTSRRSGAYGHLAASVETESATGWAGLTLESDEYINGSGHTTHQDGIRIRGSELVYRSSPEEALAASLRSARACHVAT